MKEITSTIRNYSLGFVLLGCIGSMSCTREADFDMEGAGTEEVAFSAAIGQASRRGDNAWTGGELVGMKVGDETRTYFVSDATTGAMSTDGEPYTWAAESGNYELHAWSPLTAESIALTDQSDADKMFACDLVDCKTTVNAQAVQLTFKHKMTRVWYELQVFTDYTDADADAADITFYGYKNVRYSEGTVTAEGNPDAEISPRKTDNRHGEAFLVPGEMWDKPLIKVVIAGDTYIYTPKHSVQTDEERQTGVLKEGYNQRYYLKVSKKGLEVTMESSSVGWDSETMDDVTDGKYKVETPAELTGAQLTGIENGFITSTDKTFSISYTESGNGGLLYEGNCDVKRTTDGTTHTYAFSKVASDIKITYTADYLKVGKYYYSNGTFGDEAVKEGCETVGLVYKLGASSNDYDTDKSLSLAGHICANLSPRAKKGGHKCANLPQPAKRRVRCLPLPKQIKNAVFRLERRRGNYDFLFNSVPMQNSYSSETVRYGFWYRFFHRWMRYTFAAPGVKYTGFRRSPARRPQMSAIFPAPRFPGG